MGVILKQHVKITQQLVMTPQLQQAIKLLQLSRIELMEMIRHELEENPALDEVQEVLTDEDYMSEQLHEDLSDSESSSKEVVIEENFDKDIDWSNYIDEYNAPGKVTFEVEEKDTPKYEAFIAHKESLSEHLLWQLMMTFPTEEELNIGRLIIGNLNEDGYFDIPVEEFAQSVGFAPEKINHVLSVLQTFDPVGIAAKDLKESLLIQVKQFGIENPVVVKIIKDYLYELEKKNYNAICKELEIGINELLDVVNIIKTLEPRPGRAFNDEISQYISPDIYVYKVENDFMIVLNDDGMPRLCINPFYQNAINSNGTLTEGAKEYMQEKVRSAAWLIKSIQQRQKTIYRVMESILKFQREFFEKGVEYLKPLVLRDVANNINMHESTVSRVTTNKYVHTPQGIFELKYFFNTSVNRVEGGGVASVSVHQRIKEIIEREDPKKPYTDDNIVEILKEHDINIARRTVAKYREILNIPPSSKRKRI